MNTWKTLQVKRKKTRQEMFADFLSASWQRAQRLQGSTKIQKGTCRKGCWQWFNSKQQASLLEHIVILVVNNVPPPNYVLCLVGNTGYWQLTFSPPDYRGIPFLVTKSDPFPYHSTPRRRRTVWRTSFPTNTPVWAHQSRYGSTSILLCMLRHGSTGLKFVLLHWISKFLLWKN